MSSNNKSILTLTSHSIILIGAAIGGILFWQIPKLPETYYNLSFLIAYIVSLIFISAPIFVAETASSFLSKKTLFANLRYLSGSERFRWFGILIVLASILMLIFTMGNLSSFISAFVFSTHMATTQNLQHTLDNAHTYSAVITIITSAVLIVLLLILQLRRFFIASAMILSLFGIVLFIAFFIYSIAFQNLLVALSSFFTPNFTLLSHFSLWYSAITLALFTSLIGFGAHIALGREIKTHFSYRKLTGIYLISSVIFAAIIMILYHSYSATSHTTQMTAHANPFVLTSLMLLFVILLNLSLSTLLCQVGKVAMPYTKKATFPIRLILFVLLFLAILFYQLDFSKTALSIFSESFIFSLVLFIAYVETLLFGWIFDAQKMHYALYKHTQIKMSALFNISLRLIAPTAILGTLINSIVSIYLNTNYLLDIIVFVLSFVITIVLGRILYQKFK
ncbi:hypothetical protein [Fangia hongkongensis]|uniref:hypothetical protein n=2 Tax=Fangia hongkongensis TaxID=270495 RepID=UPI000364BF90|nr:hypothetical protein [Fangia hongkongensis]